MAAANSLLYFLLSSNLAVDPNQGTNTELNQWQNGVNDMTCGYREHYSQCNAHCQVNCFNYFEKQIPCTKQCIEGCVCDKGYVRGLSGKCIRPTECPGTDKCPKGEHFDQCNARCQETCEHQEHRICPAVCFPGCICDLGTVRDANGRCIKPELCPPKKKEATEEDRWPKIEDRWPKIEDSKEEIVDKSDEDEAEDRREKIEDSSRIDKRCPENEYYTRCNAACQKNCTNYNKPFNCPKICLRGCVCKLGMVRAHDGKCIKIEKCPKKSISNLNVDLLEESSEEKDEEERREKNIEESRKELLHESLEDKEEERRENMEASRRERVHESSSSEEEEDHREKMEASRKNQFPFLCKKNEFWDVCPSRCPDDCNNYKNKDRSCRKMCLPIPACSCKDGFVKGPKGDCIRPEQCPGGTKCPENEIFTRCNGNCQKNCDNWYDDKTICPKECVRGCLCRPGEVRGPDGKCIYIFDCPEKKQNAPNTAEKDTFPGLIPIPIPIPLICKRNEVFELCPSSCPDDCLNYKDPDRKCPKSIFCKPACICDEGWVRGPNGVCINPSECPNERKQNCTDLEYFDRCGTTCEDNCDNYKIPDRKCDKRCAEGCFCLPGTIRGPDGTCIRPNKCPKKQQTILDLENESEENDDNSDENSWKNEDLKNGAKQDRNRIADVYWNN